MKTVLYTIITLLVSLSAFSQQIGNGGFEKWYGTATTIDSFVTGDDLFPMGLVSRTTQAHSGQYAALLSSGGSGFPPFLLYGRLDSSSATVTGWPFKGRPDAMKFWYRLTNTGSDTMQAIIILYDRNQGFIGYGELNLISNAPLYRQATVPIDYYSGATPDSIIIEFFQTSGSTTGAMTFYLDDVSLSYSPTEVEAVVTKKLLRIFPNPASKTLGIAVPYNACQLSIASTDGKLMYQEEVCSGRLILDVSSWPSGHYFVRCTDGVNTSTEMSAVLH